MLCPVLALCFAGCAQGSPPREGSTSQPNTTTQLPGGGVRCPQQQTEAEQLLVDAQACATDSDCSSAKEIDAPCLLAFLCPVTVARTTDLDRLRTEAQRLSATFRACTGECAIANCVATIGTHAVCNPMTKRCDVLLGLSGAAGASAQRD